MKLKISKALPLGVFALKKTKDGIVFFFTKRIYFSIQNLFII
jgi:hypothetical protein